MESLRMCVRCDDGESGLPGRVQRRQIDGIQKKKMENKSRHKWMNGGVVVVVVAGRELPTPSGECVEIFERACCCCRAPRNSVSPPPPMQLPRSRRHMLHLPVCYRWSTVGMANAAVGRRARTKKTDRERVSSNMMRLLLRFLGL